jgi:hypothetical protein
LVLLADAWGGAGDDHGLALVVGDQTKSFFC